MGDWNFGRLDGRQLTLRWNRPIFLSLGWKSLGYWWSVIRSRWNWELSCRRHVGATHRCYCDTGSMVDGRVCVAGFGVTWFYSHYTGPVPCWCDKACDEAEID